MIEKKCCRTAMIALFVILFPLTASAYEHKEEINESYIQNAVICKGIVTLDDIRSLGEKYKNDSIPKKGNAKDTWQPYLDKKSVDFFGRDSVSAYDCYYIKDTNSPYYYLCYNGAPADSHVSPYPYIEAPFMETGVTIDGDVEKFTKYIEDSRRIYEKVYENAAYIKEHLNHSQYGGYYYLMEDSKVHIYLSDSSKKNELEMEGIVCESAKYSLEQLNEKMEELWKKRQELGICSMRIFDNQVIVSIKNKEESEKIFMDDAMICVVEPSWELRNTMGSENLDSLLEWLENNRFYKEKKEYSELAAALTILKKAYPEYNYLNLFYHVGKDLDYKRYLDFPKELCEYADQLPTYERTGSFMDEIEFGDPLRLEVKRILREYKREYPDMSYQDIYEAYIKEIEENKKFSSEEKLFLYLYDKYTIIFENGEKTKKGNTLPTAIFGSVALVAGGSIVCIKKKSIDKVII